MTLMKEMERTTLEKEVTHDLIRGEFKADDAADIVSHMLSTKINFHERRNFSSYIRFGVDNEASSARIKELKQAMTDIKGIIAYAKANNLDLKISSTITVELIEG